MTLIDIKNTLSAQNIELVQVVAFDNQHCIGKDNQLAWHIPEDLKHFKEITTGGIVIMGRKTFESMGKALPNRINWVITRDKTWTADNVKIAHSIEQALILASNDVINSDKKALFIIGGGEIFKQTLPICDRLEVTQINLDVKGDTFYPMIDSHFTLSHTPKTQLSVKNNTSFTFLTYININNTKNAP